VARVIEILAEEMKRVMILTGIGAIGEITESILIREE